MGSQNRIVGKVVRIDAESIIIFRVGDKYYPANENNKQSFEAYLHTGDENYLQGLTDEVQF